MTAALPTKPDRINETLIRARCAGTDGAALEAESRREHFRRTREPSDKLSIVEVEQRLDDMPPDDVRYDPRAA